MTESETLYDDDLEQDELPRRPRRRLVTPATLTLAAIAVAAGGFVGGVLVQKQQGGGATPAAAAAGGPAAGVGRPGAGGTGNGGQAGGFSRPGAGGGNGGANGVVAGEVESVDGRDLYVTGSDGTTVRVRVDGNAKVTRTASAKVHSVHPGDTVVVTGKAGASGTVTASQLTASAAGTGVGGFGAGP
jgi:hypothetical protein